MVLGQATSGDGDDGGFSPGMDIWEPNEYLDQRGVETALTASCEKNGALGPRSSERKEG